MRSASAVSPLPLLDDLCTTLDELRSRVRSLNEVYQEAQQCSACRSPITVVDDPDVVRLHLKQAYDECRTEMLAMHPSGDRVGHVLGDALTHEIKMSRKDVPTRVVYQHTARASLSKMAGARQVMSAGGQVRTTGELAGDLVILDEVAFVAHAGVRAGPGVTLISEPSLVAYLRMWHEQVWQSATPWQPQLSGGYGDTTDELRAAILRLMAQGLTDEVIARRLGMSTRTCRRHVAEIMKEFGARSRFEAGVAAERAGILTAGSAL